MAIKMMEVVSVAGSYEGGLYGWITDAQRPEDQDVELGKSDLVWSFGAHIGTIKAVAIDSNGEVLATGGNDEYVRLYSLTTRREKGTLAQHTGSVTALEFFKSSHLLSAAQDGTVCIWRTSTWQCLHVLGGHKDAVTSLSIHPSGRMAFSASKDKTLRLWNLVEGRCAYITKPSIPRYSDLEQVQWSPDGGRYAVVAGGMIHVFDANQTGKPTAVATHLQTRRINDVQFLSEDHLVLGGDDKCLRVMDVVSGSIQDTFDCSTHVQGRIKALQIVHFPEEDETQSRIVATVSSAGELSYFDIQTGGLVAHDAAGKSSSRLTCLATCVKTSGTLNTEENSAAKKRTREPEAELDKQEVVHEVDNTQFGSAKKKKKKKPSAAAAQND